MRKNSKAQTKPFEYPCFKYQVLSELKQLANIMRDIKHEEECVKSNHALGFCTECTPDIYTAIKNLKRHTRWD